MSKPALFISDGLSFMTNAIVKNLQEADYEIIPTRFSKPEIIVNASKAELILFYLGDYVEGERDAFDALRRVVVEEGKILCLLGNDNEFSLVKSSIPDEYIAAQFTRPLDMKEVVQQLGRMTSKSARMAHKKSILLVDDDNTFLKMLHGWLADDYKVTIVNSGMQAITYLASHVPDLILLDYEMPVTDGPQVLEMIRSEESTRETPVIFLTGKGDRESVEKVLSLAPDGYLLKSIGKVTLLQKLSEFFSKHSN